MLPGLHELTDHIYTGLIEASDIANPLGVEPATINSPGSKCPLILEHGLTKEARQDFMEIRYWGCLPHMESKTGPTHSETL